MSSDVTIDESVDVEMYGKPWQGNHKGPPYLGAAVICQIAEDEQDGNINLRHISAGVVMAGFLEEFGIRLANPGDRLIFSILSPNGQIILALHGFEAPLEVRES